MKQDRFDEFYMLQTKAKGLEKKNLKESALNIYLDIIENYFPDTDFSFQRAVILLQEKNDFETIKKYCKLAIERIDASEMKGSRQFFEEQLEKLKEKPKTKKTFNFNHKFFNAKNIAIAIFLIISILLSLPNKVFKFIFLIFGAIIALLIIDIAKRFKLKLNFRLQTVGLFIAAAISLGAATQIPPPEWTNFFSLMPLSEIGANNGQTVKTNDKKDVNDIPNEALQNISEDDLAAIKQLVTDKKLADDFTLKIDNDTLVLTIYAKATASDVALKKYASKILTELSSYKGQKKYENRLGDLYKNIDTMIVCIDSYGKIKLKGKVNHYTLKIDWD